MLSNIARAALTRVVARAPSTRSVLVNSTLAQVNLSRQTIIALARCYAAAATKKSAAIKPRTRSTTTKKASGAKKSTAVKKKPARRVVKRTTKSKSKASAKLKSKKVVKKPKKVLSDRQKAFLVKAKDKDQRDKLRATALIGEDPALKPVNTYIIFYLSQIKDGVKDITSRVKEVAAAYKNLEPFEREQLNIQLNHNKADNDKTYKRWVESHTPETIRRANLARRQLHKKSTLKSRSAFRQIQDVRQPAAPNGPYTRFVTDRLASGDFRGIKQSEAFKLVASDWKALPATERARYTELGAADVKRYHQEYLTVFKHQPGTLVKLT